MNAVSAAHLEGLYADTDDPWNFRDSAYEQKKFAATLAALGRDAYVSALELGCGNGELSRHLAPLCASYTGVDAVEAAVAAARQAVPQGRFVQAFLPCVLPEGDYDLIVVSEILYFLDRTGLVALANQIAQRWPRAEILSVNWLGPSGNPLEGEEALGVFRQAMGPSTAMISVARTEHYRIDRLARS